MNAKQLKPTFFISVLLLISFFLPWVSLGIGDSNGWVLPTRAADAANYLDLIARHDNIGWLFKLAYLIYLVPAFAGYNIYRRLNRRRPAVNEYFIGLLAAILLFFLMRMVDRSINNALVQYANTEFDLGMYKMLSIGYYLFLGCCLVGLYFTVIRECDDYMSFEEEMHLEAEEYAGLPVYETPEMPQAAPKATANSVADRAQVYERLEQLHSLYEKGIINEEEFNKEKKQLLQ
ncbi:SHOCT domain-containing protein [Chitinophaga sp. Hz27]|uniref:SHOCT domain-containing protein n=1 Tax=Chitinophaga sp. Hz27 TaxID=3347169 RepID=UPI0035E13D31